MRRSAAAPAEIPPKRAASPYLPPLLVCVPRAVFDRYWPLPWADVVRAAESGIEGLTLQVDIPQRWSGRDSERNPQPDVAFLREGDGKWEGRTLLYQQNWSLFP